MKELQHWSLKSTPKEKETQKLKEPSAQYIPFCDELMSPFDTARVYLGGGGICLGIPGGD